MQLQSERKTRTDCRQGSHGKGTREDALIVDCYGREVGDNYHMGLKEWADKQVRKRDLRVAIEEAHFQNRMLQMLAAALRATEFDEDALHRFDATLPEYLELLVSGLRESQARLWGFKGKASEWMGQQKMINSGRVRWNNDRRQRLTLAIALEGLEQRIGGILSELKAGHLTTMETRAAILSEMDTFQDNCSDRITRLEDEGCAAGLIEQNDVVKLKERAEKRVGTIMRRSFKSR